MQVTAAHDLMVLSVERKQDVEVPAGVAVTGTSEPSAKPGETAGPIAATQVPLEDHVAAGPAAPHSTGQNRAAQNSAGRRQRTDAGALKQHRAQAKAAASAARQERMEADFEWDPLPQAAAEGTKD